MSQLDAFRSNSRPSVLRWRRSWSVGGKGTWRVRRLRVPATPPCSHPRRATPPPRIRIHATLEKHKSKDRRRSFHCSSTKSSRRANDTVCCLAYHCPSSDKAREPRHQAAANASAIVFSHLKDTAMKVAAVHCAPCRLPAGLLVDIVYARSLYRLSAIRVSTFTPQQTQQALTDYSTCWLML
ncbi:hypothetical protein M3J09_001663 [Ascochyta lentis]